MAKVIRTPRVLEDTRRLYSKIHREVNVDVENNILDPIDSLLGTEVNVPSIEFASLPETEPTISAEELLKLKRQLKFAEKRADDATNKLEELEEGIGQVRADAKEQGYSAGYGEAEARLKQDFQGQFDAIERLSDSFLNQLENLLFQSEDLIVETIYAAILKIVGERLVEPENIAKVVKHVANQLIRPGNFVIKLSHADYKFIKEFRASLLKQGMLDTLQIIADSNVEIGGCILESATGSLDARLETQFKRLKDIMLTIRFKRQAELLKDK